MTQSDDLLADGHFPDRPLVPGVLLLDAVLGNTEARQTIRRVKFFKPVGPGELLAIRDGEIMTSKSITVLRMWVA